MVECLVELKDGPMAVDWAALLVVEMGDCLADTMDFEQVVVMDIYSVDYSVELKDAEMVDMKADEMVDVMVSLKVVSMADR